MDENLRRALEANLGIRYSDGMLTIGDRIACTPFETTQARVEVKGGLAQLKQKGELAELKVVFDHIDGFLEGDSVWLRGDFCKHPYANEVFDLNGKKFILVPVEHISIKKHA